jgi:chemotaxis protein histidine kinase CheA/ActR/RegA family two-component response regulator
MAASFDKSSIIEFFLVEAGEHIQNLNKGLLSLEKNPADGSMIDELFRAAHTLKGSAAMMGFQGISEVAHKAEDMLGQLRSGSIPISKETMNFLFDSVDAVKLMIDGVAAKQPEDPLVIESIVQAYKDVIEKVCISGEASPISFPSAIPPASVSHAQEPTERSSPSSSKQKNYIDRAWAKTFDTQEALLDVEPMQGEPEPADQPTMSDAASVSALDSVPASQEQAAPEAPTSVESSLKEEIDESKKARVLEKRGVGRRAMDAPELEKQFIRVNIERLDNLMNLVGEVVINRNHLGRHVEFIKTLRQELAFSQTRLLHEIKKFEEKYEYTLNYSGSNRQAVTPANDFFELEFDRYDDFNLLSRKLTEITNDTNEIMTELEGFFDSFERDTAKISTITANLQDEITMARMVEMERLFQMFRRLVRDLAQEESKQVNMVVSGGETKIDKTIFEIISDPLMHMIRNAVSHGIETVEERRILGKDPTGALILDARHEGNSIILEIEDDGRGMDIETLKKTAVDKGFMSIAEAQTLTDLDAINLIFRPGFTTSQTVGMVSGRGVGMDVVSDHLAKINGRVEIRTEKNIGTRFVIRLPLTLAIAQALIIKVKEQEMAVPMNLVEETTRYSFKEIQRTAGDEMVNFRGTFIKLLKLNDILGMGKFPPKDDAYRHPTLILGTSEKRLALMVEDIVGREEIVVKTLGDYLKGVKLFSGATISGEGNVRLILNVSALLGEDGGVMTKASFIASKEIMESTVPEAALRKPKVLVVDDSISIRKYVQRFLDRTGYEVEVASDGMEALNILGKAKVDVVITDLEMPVMHGYDLIAEMKRNPVLTNIPVIVLTSRAGEKHLQQAIEMGANDYLIKPFEDQEMLEALKRLLKNEADFTHRT